MSVSSIMKNGKISTIYLPITGHPVTPNTPNSPSSPTIYIDSSKWFYNFFHNSAFTSVGGSNNSYRKVFKNYDDRFCRFNNNASSGVTFPNGNSSVALDVTSSNNLGVGELGGPYEYGTYDLSKTEIRNISTVIGERRMVIRCKGTNHCSFSVPAANSVPNIGWTDSSLTDVADMHSVMITPQIDFYIDGNVTSDLTILGSSYVETFKILASSNPQDFITNWNSIVVCGDTPSNSISVIDPNKFKTATSCKIKLSLWAGGFDSENSNGSTVDRWITLNSERGYEAYDGGSFEPMSNQANSTLNTCDVFFSILPNVDPHVV